MLSPCAYIEDICGAQYEPPFAGFHSEIQKQFFLPVRSTCATHRQAFDFQRGLTHTNRNTLPFLATRPNAIVQPKVVPHHGNTCQNIRTITYERRALDWCAELAVLDRIRLARRKHEFTGSDITWPPPKLTA